MHTLQLGGGGGGEEPVGGGGREGVKILGLGGYHVVFLRGGGFIFVEVISTCHGS